MSKFLTILFALTLSLAANAQETTLAKNSNLRSGPATTSKLLTTLPAGTSVTVISKYPRLGYVRVQDDSKENTGWVLQKNLADTSIPAPEAEAAAPAPAPEHAAAARSHSPDTLAGDPEIYPNATNTPGAPDPTVTQANIGKNICNKSWTTETVRPSTTVTNKIKKQTMVTYGFTNPIGDYELDHLISLQNGGCPDCVKNLWPQAYGDTKHPMTQNQRAAWNRAHPGDFSKVLPGSLEKDLVENHIHDEICFAVPNPKLSSYAKKYPATKGITLKRGQDILSNDWYSCYVNMMDNNKPCE